MDDNLKSSASVLRKRKRFLDDDEEINTYLENRYTSLVPGPVLEQKRNDLIKLVKNTVKAQFVDAKVRVYGSSCSGTALISSDIDFSVFVRNERPDETISQLVNLLEQGGFHDVEDRRVKDRVVIFCYHEDAQNRTYIDLTLNNKVARRASRFIRSIVDVNQKVKILVVLVKEFAKCFGIDDPKRGTLAAVGYTYMVVFVLQLNNLLPRFSRAEIRDLIASSDLIAEANAYKATFVEVSEKFGNTLQLFRTFFHYYNATHDFKNGAISIIGGQVVSKQLLGWDGGEQRFILAIVDPFGTENIGRTVSFKGINKITSAFKEAEDILAGSRPHNLFKPKGPG